MKTKRPTPQRLPSGTWRCQVMVSGTRVSVTDEDREICQAKAMAIQAGLLEKEEKKKALTLEEAIDGYLESKSDVLSPSTVRGYEFVKRKRFPSLMKQNIWTITQKDVQTAVNQEARTKVSAKTIENGYGLVRPVLKMYGIDVSGVKLPQQVIRRKKYVQKDEIETLIDAARGDSCELQILLALWLGLRRSEIMGLHWDCVDPKAGRLVIRRKLVMDKENRFVLIEGAKTVKSQRRVSCPAYIMDKLEARRHGRTEGPVFTQHPDTVRQHIHAICRKTGITDTSTHGLRHTNAAVMNDLGVSDAHAMERGGWSEERTYKATYSYVFESTAKEEDALVDEFFASKT
ncbi:MAG: site-specific integrase [Clostridia bacterium]|nr:site-specific integrase [Clostridia bacterium]